jgi:hypothetical protein
MAFCQLVWRMSTTCGQLTRLKIVNAFSLTLRTRVNPVANVKIKNNLLAITLVFTSLPPSVTVSKIVIEEICYAIGQNLSAAVDRPELGLTAIHCATTLLQASLRVASSTVSSTPIPSAVLQHIALNLISPLINYVAESVVSSSAGEIPPIQVEGVKQVVKGLVSWTNGMPETAKPRGFAILLPTLSLLLDRDASAPSGLHLIATTTMLGLAQASPAAFKDATQAMEEGERGRLEKAVREAVGQRAERAAASGSGGMDKKVIELRSFG